MKCRTFVRHFCFKGGETLKLQRYDRSLIKDYMGTPEGYLTVNVPITRPGVFP